MGNLCHLDVFEFYLWCCLIKAKMLRGIENFNTNYLLIWTKVNSNILCQTDCSYLCWPLFKGDIGSINLCVIFYFHFAPPIKYTYTVTTTNLSGSSATIGTTYLT